MSTLVLLVWTQRPVALVHPTSIVTLSPPHPAPPPPLEMKHIEARLLVSEPDTVCIFSVPTWFIISMSAEQRELLQYKLAALSWQEILVIAFK